MLALMYIQGCCPNQHKCFESQKWPQGPLKACHRWKIFAFHDAIIKYHYLSRNPKSMIETVN